MYNITTIDGNAYPDGYDEETQAEFTLFGTKNSITWWRNIISGYWPHGGPNISDLKVDNEGIPQQDIGDITGVKVRFGTRRAVTYNIAYRISSFTVTANICNSGVCKATVFTTAPSASKVFSLWDATATYFKLYPLKEFATSRAFMSNFVL